LWDVATGRERCRHKANAGSLAFSPGGTMLASNGKLWLVADLLDEKLHASLAEASKWGDVSRVGLCFHIQVKQEASDDTLAVFQKVPRQVSLSFTDAGKITDKGLAHLKDMPNLRDLDLRKAGIIDEGLAHLAGLKLRTLGLEQSAVTDAGL